MAAIFIQFRRSSTTVKSRLQHIWRTKPLLANCGVYGCLWGAAELTNQTRQKLTAEPKENRRYDLASVGKYMLLGSTFVPVFLFKWYGMLDRVLGIGTHKGIVATKLFLDQVVSAPFNLSVFFVYMSAMEGKEDIFAECREKLWQTYKTCCLFWIPITSFNFAFIPPHFRVIYTAACSFVWTNILCIIKSMK